MDGSGSPSAASPDGSLKDVVAAWRASFAAVRASVDTAAREIESLRRDALFDDVPPDAVVDRVAPAVDAIQRSAAALTEHEQELARSATEALQRMMARVRLLEAERSSTVAHLSDAMSDAVAAIERDLLEAISSAGHRLEARIEAARKETSALSRAVRGIIEAAPVVWEMLSSALDRMERQQEASIEALRAELESSAREAHEATRAAITAMVEERTSLIQRDLEERTAAEELAVLQEEQHFGTLERKIDEMEGRWPIFLQRMMRALEDTRGGIEDRTRRLEATMARLLTDSISALQRRFEAVEQAQDQLPPAFVAQPELPKPEIVTTAVEESHP